jgi:PAS domain S-box-containing protein
MVNQSQHTILVVNDSPDQLELMKFILRKADYNVVTAASGNQAFNLIKAKTPDLVISDVMMADGDGIELCRRIRAVEKLQALPFLLLSALRRDTSSVIEGLEVGADDYIESPFDSMHLIARVARLIERKRTEDELRESKERYRHFIEQSTEGIWRIEFKEPIPTNAPIENQVELACRHGYYAECNDAMAQMYGFKSSKCLIGKYFTELLIASDEENRKFIRAFMENVYRITDTESHEIDKSGQDKYFLNNLVGVVENGFLISVWGTQRDVTYKRQAEKALRESEEKFKAQYVGIPLPTYTWQKVEDDFILVDFNKAAEKATHGKMAEFLGIHATSMYHDLPEMIKDLHKCFDEKRAHQREMLYKFRVDGRVRMLDFNYAFVPPDMVMIHTRDITEQKQAETALRESEKKFRKVLENSLDVIYQLNLKDKSFDYVSPGIKRITGYSHEEILAGGFTFSTSLIHPDDLENVRQAVKNLLNSTGDETTNSGSFEYRIKTKEKGYCWLSDNRTVVRDENNNPVSIIATARDITEQKQAEATLRFQKTLLEAQSEASIDGILIVSADGNIILHNRRFAEMWEIPQSELNSKSDETVLHLVTEKLLNPKEFLETVDYLYRHPDEINQVEIPLKDGRVFDRYTGPVKDGKGVYYGRVWFFHDISSRKKADEAIRFQAKLLDTVEQAVIGTNMEGIVTYWNQFASKLYGWSAEEAAGQNIMKLTTPDDSLERAEKIMSRLTKGKSWTGEFLVRNREGKSFPALIVNSPIHNDKGELVGIVGVSNDISERKQTETALIEANERAIRQYNTLLQRLAKLGQTVGVARDLDAIFTAVLDFARASSSCSALIISLYNEKEKMRKVIYCWYNEEEMDISDFEVVPVGEGVVGQAVKTGEVIIVDDYQATVQKSDVSVAIGFDKDARYPQSAIVAPMKIKGNCVGIIEVQSYEASAYKDEHSTAMSMAANFIANAVENVRLLELERQREEQLRQSQKLESVGRLAGGIAHDFNNMLTAINGYSNLTLRRLRDDDPLRHNIEEIKKAGERSAELTHQLLAFSRQQVLKPKVLDINQSINEISFMLKRLIGEDVQLIAALSQEIGQVKVDPGQLSQVIMNLAVNARDAMPQGGALTIETRNVYLDEEYAASHIPTVAGHYIMLAVSDSGTGIAPETREHIFEPFFTTKEVGKGTGLGLATVYGIVKQSGGYIWVDSELEKGTTFKIYLPRIDENFDTEKKSDIREEMASGMEKILLVEDEQMVRNLSRQILENCGYTIIEASNGAEAFEMCSRSDYEIDLLLTDVVMPKMGGRELAEKLAETHPQMKVLFTSGYTDDSVVRHGVIEEGTNFIQKPYTPTGLAFKVRSILDAKIKAR